MFCLFVFLILESEKPSLKGFVLHIKPQLQCLNTWYNLGVLLDVPVQKLEDIRSSEQDDIDLCCVKMFIQWLENGTDTTWNTLLRAVDSVNIGSHGMGTCLCSGMITINFYALISAICSWQTSAC